MSFFRLLSAVLKRPLLALAVWLPLSGVLAYFLAGALIFPLIHAYYGSRVLTSLGLMAIVYGLECLMRAGLIETCGFVSGNCSQHDMSSQAQGLWLVLALGGLIVIGIRALRGRRHGN